MAMSDDQTPFVGEIESCKHINWVSFRLSQLPRGWRRWRPIDGKGLFGAIHRAALFAMIEQGYKEEDMHAKMVKRIGQWVRKGQNYFPDDYNQLKFLYNLLKEEDIHDFLSEYDEHSNQVDDALFKVCKIAVAEYVRNHKDWYADQQQEILRAVMNLDMAQDFVKVQISNPEQANVEGLEYYFKLFSKTFHMNFNVSYADETKVQQTWSLIQEEGYPTRNLIYFQRDQTTIYLLQEVTVHKIPTINNLTDFIQQTNRALASCVDFLTSFKIKSDKEYREKHISEKKKLSPMDAKYRQLHILENLGLRARHCNTQALSLLENANDNAKTLRDFRAFEHSHFSNALSRLSHQERLVERFGRHIKKFSGVDDDQEEEKERRPTFLISSITEKGLLVSQSLYEGIKCAKCKKNMAKMRVPQCAHALCQACLRASVESDSEKLFFTSEYSKKGAALLKCPMKGCLSLIDYRLVNATFTGNVRVNEQFERYVKEYTNGKEKEQLIVANQCMSCKESNRELFGATETHNEHKMCATCWKKYVGFWEAQKLPLCCPFYECQHSVKMSDIVYDRIMEKSNKPQCSHCKAVLNQNAQCCDGNLCQSCLELNAKNQYYHARSELYVIDRYGMSAVWEESGFIVFRKSKMRKVAAGEARQGNIL